MVPDLNLTLNSDTGLIQITQYDNLIKIKNKDKKRNAKNKDG